MTTLASRAPYPAPSHPANMAPAHYRVPNGNSAHAGVFTSPTESEFSDSHREGPQDSIVHWDEGRVGEWLRSINCGQWANIFRQNHITGEVLLDIDTATLKEMGINKLGDRVRIGSAAKVFRNAVYKKTSKRSFNRVSIAHSHGPT